MSNFARKFRMASSFASTSSPKPNRNPEPKPSSRKKKSSRRRRLNRKRKRNWLELPPDVMASILQRVGSIDILENVQRVCTAWRNICKDPSMWRKIDMGNSKLPYDLEMMCRHAVDRSEGQLTDINIEYFGTDELLQYISDRSSQLRRLRLVCCYYVSSEGLSEAVKKLPLLEELHLYYTSIDKEAIETVGQSCPLLKSFKLNNRGCRSGIGFIEFDEEAMAIAKNMPELRNLQLFGHKLTNVGLQAILDGCCNLESLDLRQCFNLTLAGNLGRRCFDQIKDLRRPHDSTKDYEFDTKDYLYESFEEDYDLSYDDYLSGFSDLDLYDDDDFCDTSRYNSDFTEYDGMPW